MRSIAPAGLAWVLVACAPYRQELNRGQRLYEEDAYEQALALWRVLEHQRQSLSWADRARYAYLRGMTEYRLGYRRDARHWLALAHVIQKQHPGGLRRSWVEQTHHALQDLNRRVYGLARPGRREPVDGGLHRIRVRVLEETADDAEPGASSSDAGPSLSGDAGWRSSPDAEPDSSADVGPSPPKDAGAGSPSDAEPASRSPANAESGLPSDASTGSEPPSDAGARVPARADP